MKNTLITLCLMIAAVAYAAGTPGDELKRIQALSAAMSDGGIVGLLATARSNVLVCPRIPSNWHIQTRCPSNEWRKVLDEARDFGLALAVTLDGEAPDFQSLPVGEELERRATRLCNLSEWCAATTGYGNVFLAQRSLDLAAVGLARLTADLDYPFDACEKLAARMQPEWMSVSGRAAVFNDEAGAQLFSGKEPPEEFEKMLGTGKHMLKLSQGWKVPFGWRTAAPSRYVNKTLFEKNLDFFAFVEDDRTVPYTVVALWNYPRYYQIAIGLELQTIRKALPLVEFRKVVGAFPEVPEEPVLTEEQKESIKREAERNRQLGVKTSRRDQSPYYNPIQEAFRQAWQRQPNLPIERYNEYGNAFQAYDEVKRGCFLDQDTINAKLFKDRQDRQEVIRRQMEEARATRSRHSTTNIPALPQ